MLEKKPMYGKTREPNWMHTIGVKARKNPRGALMKLAFDHPVELGRQIDMAAGSPEEREGGLEFFRQQFIKHKVFPGKLSLNGAIAKIREGFTKKYPAPLVKK
ncbi:MAG: hypothetical protein V1676_07235 [Candidatus Diapherotrites archaeon]